jgi:hypothetical protein
VQSTVTNESGIYRFPALAPGRYDMGANLAGFAAAKNTNVVLTLGSVLTIDLSMALAGVSESVQVTAESPLIDVKQNASTAIVSTERIDRIPKGRNFTDVLGAVPGANVEARAGGVSVGGASGSENRFVVDGIDTTNLQNGSSGKTYITDFISEVQVKTAGYNAEFPGATGGVVNAITKSGTNTFHGSGGFYYRNNGPTGVGNKDKSNFWVGNQRPSLRLSPSNTTVAEYFTTPLDEQPLWEPVVEGGGPVLRDKLWYYAGYAPVRTHTTRTVTWQTPVAGGPATQTFTQDNPVDRLTTNVMWQPSNAWRAKFGYNPQWSRSRHNLPGIGQTARARRTLRPTLTARGRTRGTTCTPASWTGRRARICSSTSRAAISCTTPNRSATAPRSSTRWTETSACSRACRPISISRAAIQITGRPARR